MLNSDDVAFERGIMIMVWPDLDEAAHITPDMYDAISSQFNSDESMPSIVSTPKDSDNPYFKMLSSEDE